MMQPPARVGEPRDMIDTPALMIDLPALERNLDRMAAYARDHNLRLRPHAKTHKSPDIARLQMARGAIGVCCQKVSEAEALVEGGIGDVLVSNEIVGEAKVTRLAALAKRAAVTVLADHADLVMAYGAAARRFGVTLSVLVELHAGDTRPGVVSSEAALDLARLIDTTDGLRFAGLQAYQGSAQHIRDFAERRDASAAWARKVGATHDLIVGAGIACDIVTGGGTGTFGFEGESGVFNEIQPGSYTVMDVDYGLNLEEGGGRFAGFENSLFLVATVISRNFPDFAVIDAGTKASNVDIAMPTVWQRPGLRYAKASDDHGAIE
ncbi:MAG: DSD1 family PLP-dependent enzyme, partial [Rhodospirillales bacterium]|nr:DSD1 family PLP-dependent enzyme [Rhodospirillales bacterium]